MGEGSWFPSTPSTSLRRLIALTRATRCTLSPAARRIAIVHDPLIAFAAQDVVSLPNSEAYALHWCFCVCNFLLHNGSSQFEFLKFDVGDLYNTCREMEGKFIDLLGQEQINENKGQWAVGPLNPIVIGAAGDSHRRHKCLEWLDKQAPRSALCVSFGTTTSLTDDQIIELAIGLEQSKVPFVWVLRDADRGDIFAGDEEVRRTQLPKGYEDRVRGMGMSERLVPTD
ncbi:hypothetical protein HHK36_005800 [Tetracentron sinense]|uniref:Glycosyltransferase N-terminal domain-containing protein n=2 Tax=Tetracentron sinense TaxID=13715 RepID=A0A834ZM24_TETSI|nr:hypothetical protein HHK36_005800 [Tetracentron sinense]